MNEMLKTLLALVVALFALNANADCVFGAKSKMSYVVLDAHTILLKNGPGKDILIKSFAFFNTASSLTVLKDSFCDYESAVLYLDGQVVDVQQVKWV